MDPGSAHQEACQEGLRFFLHSDMRRNKNLGMGFIWDVTKGIITLGGSIRLDDAQARYEAAAKLDFALRENINGANTQIESMVASLKQKVGRTKSRFKIANKMIAPRFLSRVSILPPDPEVSSAQRKSNSIYAEGSTSRNLVGSGGIVTVSALTGTSAALLAWQGAQIVGIASTGTAMFGLHGIAATNAGWALFGGGSLATGGGGMALGHLILPGVGVAIAIGFGAMVTHREANKVNGLARQAEVTNKENEAILVKVKDSSSKVREALLKFEQEDALWSEQFTIAKQALRRFGWFSTMYRLIHFKVSGVYYTTQEWEVVSRLEQATRDFFSAMTVERCE